MIKLAYTVFGSLAFIGALCVLYKLVVWAKTRSKGAFIFAMFLPIITAQPIPPPTFENVEEAKKIKKENQDDSGDPKDPEPDK